MNNPLHSIHPFLSKNSLSLSPGEWLNVTGLSPQALGHYAHDIISNHFEAKSRLSKKDYYFDNSRAGKLDQALCDFIIRKNPQMHEWDKREIRRAVMQRPDILIHAGRTCEFYEIKPDSIDGMLQGDKIYSIAISMDFFNLPYRLGVSFLPDPFLFLGSTLNKGKKYDFHFVAALIKPGLISYRFCVSTDINTNITFDKENNVADYFREFVKTQTTISFEKKKP